MTRHSGTANRLYVTRNGVPVADVVPHVQQKARYRAVLNEFDPVPYSAPALGMVQSADYLPSAYLKDTFTRAR